MMKFSLDHSHIYRIDKIKENESSLIEKVSLYIPILMKERLVFGLESISGQNSFTLLPDEINLAEMETFPEELNKFFLDFMQKNYEK